MNKDKEMMPRTRSGKARIRQGRGAAAALLMALALSIAGAARSAPAVTAHDVPAAGYSARGLLDAADASLAAGRPGAAIVELERARLLAPRSPLVAARLEHARQIASLPPARAGLMMRVVQTLSGTEWSRLALGGLALGAAGVILSAWGLLGRKRAAFLMIGSLTVASLALLAAAEISPSPADAVIIAAGEPVRIAPFSGAESSFSLPEGTPVRVAQTHGDYALVSASEGQGWVPRSGVETILPGDVHRP